MQPRTMLESITQMVHVGQGLPGGRRLEAHRCHLPPEDCEKQLDIDPSYTWLPKAWFTQLGAQAVNDSASFGAWPAFLSKHFGYSLEDPQGAHQPRDPQCLHLQTNLLELWPGTLPSPQGQEGAECSFLPCSFEGDSLRPRPTRRR